ncbi:hypothetical protein OHA37_34635 [Streptomyces sp. NBC_00335]|uniref:hypothetical protein n=1 Tax=unclassified Streptomyces TaxID=2593676 RepID=UPI002250AED3|nr:MULTISPECIES: hypothetical protein [unclassified Streptomyces]MCX5408981.1 hypothetical protein [Streptomyces sp. NBC_00086]
MTGPHAPQGDDDYSATVLGSHWITGPPQGTERTERLDGAGATERTGATAGTDATARFDVPVGAVPDRVEGSVLRFGPGVTAALPLPFPVAPVPRTRRRPGEWRRYTLAAVVLIGVLCYLGWQRYGPALEVRDVAVTTDAKGPGCDGTADVVAVVQTNGRPGTLTYRWLRSDGTRSEQLTERVPSGRKEARLHLLWTFQGAGTYPAKAELELVSPVRHTAAAEFTYRCRP